MHYVKILIICLHYSLPAVCFRFVRLLRHQVILFISTLYRDFMQIKQFKIDSAINGDDDIPTYAYNILRNIR